MCVDFTDINRAYPKEHYLLPTIDRLVDATLGNVVCLLVDAISGYHLIKMNPKDEEKTSFITDLVVYCYKVMPFDLKNARATY